MDARFSNDTSALLSVEATGDITIHSSELKNINALGLDSLVSSTLLGVSCETRSSSTVTVQNSTFSTLYGQTAIDIESCLNASIKDSNFTGLIASKAEPNFDYLPTYSAVAIDSSTATLDTCRFTNISGGSAIYTGCSNTTFVENCTFSNNTGGAIVDLSTKTYISNSIFHNNSKLGSGGAVSSFSQSLVVNTCDFLGNNAAMQGGALYVLWGNTTINNCSFWDNVANVSDEKAQGGAIYIDGVDSRSSASFGLYVLNSTFLRNNASSAGAICSWQLPGVVYIDQCSFAQNDGHHAAADLYVFGGSQRVTTLIVHNSSFTENRSQFSVYAYFLECFGVQSSNFSNSMYGGVHSSSAGGQCGYLDHSYGDLFNTTSISEHAESTDYIDAWLEIQVDALFSNDIRNCRFENMSQLAALLIQGGLSSRVVVAQSAFVGCTFTHAFQAAVCSHVVVWNSTFINNTNGIGNLNGNGAAISSEQAGMLIGNCTFSDNTALKGGAIWGDSLTRLSISSSQFEGNRARATGGAIYSDGPELYLWGGTTLLNNRANEDGGGLFCNECGQVQLENAHIIRNRSALVTVLHLDLAAST